MTSISTGGGNEPHGYLVKLYAHVSAGLALCFGRPWIGWTSTSRIRRRFCEQTSRLATLRLLIYDFARYWEETYQRAASVTTDVISSPKTTLWSLI